MNEPGITPLQVLAEYPGDYRPENVVPLGSAGGLSGAEFWRIRTPLGDDCLRCWPKDEMTEERLAFIHSVLAHVARGGFLSVPLPRVSRRGQTFVRHEQHLWELTRWLPGKADYREAPSPNKLSAALAALAEFHRAAATFPTGISRGRSPGIGDRLARLRRWLAGDVDDLKRFLDPRNRPDVYRYALSVLDLVPRVGPWVLAVLEAAVSVEVPLQPCIRDIWYAHVLFEGDEVRGLIDFGSMRIENVAADVARLLGSMVVDDPVGWHTGLAAYESVRPFSFAERKLIEAFDRSTVLMAGLNWIDWIYRQGRSFPAGPVVPHRMEEIVARLRRLAQTPRLEAIWDAGGTHGLNGGIQLP